jgi:hypothetical protein
MNASSIRGSGPDRRALLCPSLWCSPLGVVQIMRRARPMTADEHRKLVLDKYIDVGRAWDYRGPGDDEAPFEPKASDWGWFGGRGLRKPGSVKLVGCSR